MSGNISVLSIGPGASVAVHSLAIDAVRRNSKVATLSFHTLPDPLSEGSKDQWKFALPSDEDEDTVDTKHTLILDTHFAGFTPLQHSEEDSCDVDVIAMSGLGGHAFDSFKERGGSFMWLRDALPLDFPNARILIYGYDTRLVRSSSFQNLTDLGRALQIDMKAIRVIAPRICTQTCTALYNLKEEMDETGASILNSTRGFLFFGVPHQGMDIESFVPLVKDQPNRGLLESLNKNSAFLIRLQQDFRNALGERHIPIISFYETEESPTAVEISDDHWELSGPLRVFVDASSATCGSKTQHPIGRSHSEMVKYSDQYDALYIRVKTTLQPLLWKVSGMRDAKIRRACGVFLLHGRGTLLQKMPLGVFRALLNSMLKSFPVDLSEVTLEFEDREKLFGSYEKGRWTWTEKELQESLFRVLTKGTKAHPVVIFVDALDESVALGSKSAFDEFLKKDNVQVTSNNSARARELEKSYLVDVNAKDKQGETPLTAAITLNAEEVIYKLLEVGAEHDDKDMLLASESGITALVNSFSFAWR
ncbi:hypothetical protein CNMCM7691_002514 [Aspergillus felis]|uniref:Ankyrin repeat protein n=1 Tax=Aspergillus felis TaxID=1287682 RepID=A0A8H6QMM9_9EURO|nr:hypothetical protein CNMCM7691_002514 [Aspergillus felis]